MVKDTPKLLVFGQSKSDVLSESLYRLIGEIHDSKMNPLFLMIESGARGNKSQLKQIGACALDAKPKVKLLNHPSHRTLEKGLTVLEYSISSHGAVRAFRYSVENSWFWLLDKKTCRRGARRDCHGDGLRNMNAIDVSAIKQGQEELLPIKDRYLVAPLQKIFISQEIAQNALQKQAILNAIQAEAIDDADWNSAHTIDIDLWKPTRHLHEMLWYQPCNGRPVGLGESGWNHLLRSRLGNQATQLTMRTFHLGGIAAASFTPEIEAPEDGILVD